MPKMQVDRFEEGLAVLMDDDDNTYAVPRELFGFTLHSGDVLEVVMQGGEIVSACYLAKETEELRAKAKALMEKLRRK